MSFREMAVVVDNVPLVWSIRRGCSNLLDLVGDLGCVASVFPERDPHDRRKRTGRFLGITYNPSTVILDYAEEASARFAVELRVAAQRRQMVEG